MKKLILISAVITEIFFQVHKELNMVKSVGISFHNTNTTHHPNYNSKDLFKIALDFSGGSSLGITYYFSKNTNSIDLNDVEFSFINLFSKDEV